MANTIGIVVDETTRQTSQEIDFQGTTKLGGTALATLLAAKVAATEYLADVDVAAPLTLTEVQGIVRYRVTGTTAITLPTPTGDSKFWPHIINMGAGEVTITNTLNTSATPAGVAGPHSLPNKYDMMAPQWDGTAWFVPDSITP